ncbi:MAG: TonB-dependent receptor [Candidatus Aminicenantes bacterium]|nr:MAG: TonB-dependent receptor [Candidatus Aminicenantes bacterium]
MRKFKTLSILVAVLMIASSALFAQTQSGTLKITVVDDEGTALPGVSLTLSSPVMMGEKTLISNAAGEVLFVNLTPGIYQIKSSLPGFQEKTSESIEVSLDRQTVLQIELKQATIEESITVVAVTPAVDTTKSVIAEHVTHEIVESLPIARDFVGYLQLAAGVNMVPNSGGRDLSQDPAGKGGMNYWDRGFQGAINVDTGGGKRGSRDNVYFLDGVNITGMAAQRALMTFNNEVIQEQELMTSGVPAEYGGGKGVVGNIVTKSGGNRFTGSANFYFQPAKLFLDYGGSAYDSADDSTMLEGFKDNKYDTAATFGGPLLKDRVWFFLSGQYRNNAKDFRLSESASSIREEVNYKQKRTGLFGKASFKLTPNDSFTFLYFLDDYTVEGSRDKTEIKTRQPLYDYNMGVYSGYYQRIFGENLIVDFRYGHYWWGYELGPRFPDAGVEDRLYFMPGEYPPIEQFQFGSYSDGADNRNTRDQFSLNAELYLGNMRIKSGVMYTNEYDKDDVFYPLGEVRSSLDPSLVGVTLGELYDVGIMPHSEFDERLVPWLNSHWGPTSDAYDANGDGVVTSDELKAATYSAMGENGLNFMRTYQVEKGPNKVRAQRWIGYLMDDWKISDYFTLNAGVRVENHHYKDSKGETILNMDFVFLPRIGLVWNIGGRGTHKLTAFYGHFSDPTPMGMVHFAGNLSGRVRHEQIWLNNDWYTFRIRGGEKQRDCEWTPSTRDGFAREFSLTHEIDLGNGLVIATQGYYRGDRRIIEDYDLFTYVEHMPDDYSHLALTFEDFGYPPEGPPPNINYFLSNLWGAKRDIYGIDFEVSKRFETGSFIVAQYSYKYALGNSQSDANADLQGDFIFLDPRNDWMWGPTPGTIPHKIKIFGTYRTPFGLDIGGLFYWNTGMKYTESFDFYPDRYDIYYNWPLDDGTYVKTGQEKTQSYYQVDLKFNYAIRLYDTAVVDLFLDVYNLTNNQAGIDLQYAHNEPKWGYQEITEILMPMRLYVGARIRF